MSQTTTTEFKYWENDDDFELLGTILKAISHPVRLKILHILFQDEVCIKDLVNMTGVNQSNVSRHIGILRSKGMIGATRVGGYTFYRIISPEILQMMGSDHQKRPLPINSYFSIKPLTHSPIGA